MPHGVSFHLGDFGPALDVEHPDERLELFVGKCDALLSEVGSDFLLGNGCLRPQL